MSLKSFDICTIPSSYLRSFPILILWFFLNFTINFIIFFQNITDIHSIILILSIIKTLVDHFTQRLGLLMEKRNKFGLKKHILKVLVSSLRFSFYCDWSLSLSNPVFQVTYMESWFSPHKSSKKPSLSLNILYMHIMIYSAHFYMAPRIYIR